MNRSDIDTAIHNYTAILDSATPDQIVQARAWYGEAQDIAHHISALSGLDIEKSASILAAFSPRERWNSNVTKAIDFVSGITVNGLTNNINMAYAAMTEGFNALNGLKTNNFARNIAGDMDAVTIDVWMIRGAGLNKNGVNDTEYKLLSEIVKELASERAMYPATAQALIWIIVRGNHK